MTNEEILEILLASGREFSIAKGDGIISFSVFNDEEEDYTCDGDCDNYPLYVEEEEKDDSPSVKRYEFSIWSLPVGSKNKFTHYNELKSSPKMASYCPIYHAEILTTNTGTKLLEEIWDELNRDDNLWFAPCVSDIIQVNGEFYYIDGTGFVVLPTFDKR